MADPTLLAMALVLPLGGAVTLPFLRSGGLGRSATLAVMIVVLGLVTRLFIDFDGSSGLAQYSMRLPFLPSIGASLHFALDGYNAFLVLLTALLFPVVLACAWPTAEGRSPLFLGLMLLLEAALLGTFLAQDLLVFFVLWEAVLIPMVLLILVFGGPQRRKAAMNFFLYTMAGSVVLLAAVIYLGNEGLRQLGHWTFDYAALERLELSGRQQTFVFFAIALACAVKAPLFPFHAWLPLAYREGSPSATALMAGVLSKMGAYGFLRLALPLAPDAAARFAALLVGFAATSIFYGAVLALRQRDYKMLVAYASLSHMGYIVLGAHSACSPRACTER